MQRWHGALEEREEIEFRSLFEDMGRTKDGEVPLEENFKEPILTVWEWVKGR
jgi:hypothetical protein